MVIYIDVYINIMSIAHKIFLDFHSRRHFTMQIIVQYFTVLPLSFIIDN